MSSFSSDRSIWTYRRLRNQNVELGAVQGYEVDLPVHFHDEDQLTFVISGQRRFALRHTCASIRAGEGILLPAGMPHGSLPEHAGVCCINLYLPPGVYDAETLIQEAS